MTLHQKLLALVKSRKGQGLTFGRGFWAADAYVKSLADCVGTGMCQRRFGDAQGQFSTVLKEAAGKLTYCGESLDIEKDARFRVKLATSVASIKSLLGDMELPKHAMMAFAHTLTTPREDRDGDILHTDGAQVDPKMPLLWQHVHTLPIGRALKTLEKSADRLRMASVLLDMNELTHDAAILIEADALRFSHGFRALEFTERNKEVAGAPGFSVKSFEIMEESLVSVPSNIDAEVEIFSRGKLKSAEFKAHAKAMSAMRTKQHAGVNMNFGSFADLKAAADAGTITVAGKPLEIVQPAGEAKSDSKPDCGCGGKCGGCGDHKDAGKASMPREHFATQQQAEARAAELGCTGSHYYDGKWCPCQDEYSFGLYAKPTVDPAVPLPSGRADAAVVLDKSWVDSGALKGSYFYRMNKLNDSALRHLMSSGIDVGRDDYASVWAMFDKYAIVVLNRSMVSTAEPSGNDGSRYFRCEWSETKKEPMWIGPVTEVEVSSDVSINEVGKNTLAQMAKSIGKLIDVRAGRTLSQANVNSLQGVVDDLGELANMELSRSASALISQARRTLESLLDSAKPGDDEKPKSFDAKDAASVLLQSKDSALLKQVQRAIDAVLSVHKANEKAAPYKSLMRR